jgi:hypothetical protein
MYDGSTSRKTAIGHHGLLLRWVLLWPITTDKLTSLITWDNHVNMLTDPPSQPPTASLELYCMLTPPIIFHILQFSTDGWRVRVASVGHPRLRLQHDPTDVATVSYKVITTCVLINVVAICTVKNSSNSDAIEHVVCFYDLGLPYRLCWSRPSNSPARIRVAFA